jgi:hypothetical protein
MISHRRAWGELRSPSPPADSEQVTRTRWKDLSPGTRKVILGAAAAEGALKIAALFDLTRRPSSQIRGSKLGWAAAIIFVNSLGAVPISYFVRGRQSN